MLKRANAVVLAVTLAIGCARTGVGPRGPVLCCGCFPTDVPVEGRPGAHEQASCAARMTGVAVLWPPWAALMGGALTVFLVALLPYAVATGRFAEWRHQWPEWLHYLSPWWGREHQCDRRAAER